MRYMVCALIVILTGCTLVHQRDAEIARKPPLVGAWIVTATRPGGVGKNLLTFSSDGTFFRSGDTHPVLSGGHGAWRQVGDSEFEATYVAFRFDENKKWVGSTRTRIRVTASAADEFTGVAKVSTRDLEDKEIGKSEVKLEGKRIQVDPF
jgi:hypothetical protein